MGRVILCPVRFRLSLIALLALPAGCAVAPAPSSAHAACLQRMNAHAAALLPGFVALGYRPEVRLQLDDDMRAGGFRLPGDVLGDATPGGRIRLRTAAVCGDAVTARAVVAHEMAHVALKHLGAPASGVTLEWEPPAQQEVEADRLALEVLRRIGGQPAAESFIECHMTSCAGTPLPRRSGAGRGRAAP